MSADDREPGGGCATVTRRQRQARNARVFADRARGLSWAVIEDRHGISERQGRRIVDAPIPPQPRRVAVYAYIARRPRRLEFDPDAVIRELLGQFEQASVVEELEAELDRMPDPTLSL